jgi:hypothetical protein
VALRKTRLELVQVLIRIRLNKSTKLLIQTKRFFKDVNECEDLDACPPEAQCINKIGGHTCYCGLGFQYANKTCKCK